MPLPIVGLIWGSVVSLAPFIVVNVLKAIGFGLISFTGMTLALNQLESWVWSNYNGLGSDLFQVLSLLDVDTGVSMVFTAYTTRFSISRVYGAVHQVWRKPGTGFIA